LGNVPATQTMPIAATLAQISFAPIQSAVDELLFLPPRGGKRRVVALALADESEKLSALQAEVSAALADLGVYTPPGRPYAAHLTVARYRHPGPALSLQNVNVPTFGLEQMTLYDSVLERAGAVHTPLAVFPAIYERSPSG
jgi:2'-5' RNA ligase